jgi:hypothetical protein
MEMAVNFRRLGLPSRNALNPEARALLMRGPRELGGHRSSRHDCATARPLSGQPDHSAQRSLSAAPARKSPGEATCLAGKAFGSNEAFVAVLLHSMADMLLWHPSAGYAASRAANLTSHG